MTGPQWPGVHLVSGELEHMPRRQAFIRAHPGAEFDHVGGAYIGHVPYAVDGKERSITLRGDSWTVVLDALEEYFSDGEQDTG